MTIVGLGDRGHLSPNVHGRRVFHAAQGTVAFSWAENAEALRDESVHFRFQLLQPPVCITLLFSNIFRYGFVAVTQLAHVRRSPEPQQLTARGHLSKLARFEKPQTFDMKGHQSNLHTHQ